MFAGQETINNKGQITNQENFNKALLAIMEDRYKGGAEKLANTTKGMLSTVTGITKSALSKIVGIQEDGTIKSGSLIDKIKEKVKSLADKLTEWQSDGTLDNIANKATEVFTKIYNVVSKFINFIIDHKDIIITIGSMAVAFTVVSKAIRGVSIAIKAFQVVWAILNGTILLSPIGWVIIGITALVGTFTLLWLKCEGFRKIVISIGQAVVTWFQGNIMPALQGLWNSLTNPCPPPPPPLAPWIVSVLGPVFNNVFSAILQYAGYCFSGLGTFVQGLIEEFSGIIDFITGVFTGNWELAWNGVKKIFGGIFDQLVGLAKGPLNAIIRLTNKAIDGINTLSFTVPDWVPDMGGQTIGVNIPHIPELATGSNYTKSGLTLVGEHGPELVNMKSGNKVSTNSETKKLLSNGKEINLNIHIDTFIGQESFADSIGEHIWNKIQLALVNM